MFLRTQRLMAVKALMLRMLANLVDATPARVLDVDSKICLYKVGPSLEYDTEKGDLTECDFTGYTRVTLASVLGPINLPEGQAMHKEIDFLATAPFISTPQDALGMFILDTDGLTLLAAEQFAEPVPFATDGDALSYDLILAPKIEWGGEQGA